MKGRVVRTSHESQCLSDNPLGDPHERDLYVYLPPQYDGTQRFPVVMMLAGFGSTNHSIAGWSPWKPNSIELFDRLIAVSIPRIRDFRGLSPKGFDGRGNYSFGVTEQLIFPQIDYDKIMKVRGMDITLVTTAETDEQGRALLDAFGFPFRRQQVGA